jgi:phage terminase small subunit
MLHKLTAKQAKFIEEYLVDLNATQAAIRAGYSMKTAKDIACENLAKPNIASAIACAQDELSQRTKITIDCVLAGLLTEAGNTGEGSSHSARVSAWSHLGKHLGMFVERREISGRDGKPIEVAGTSAIERLRAMLNDIAERNVEAG